MQSQVLAVETNLQKEKCAGLPEEQLATFGLGLLTPATGTFAA